MSLITSLRLPQGSDYCSINFRVEPHGFVPYIEYNTDNYTTYDYEKFHSGNYFKNTEEVYAFIDNNKIFFELTKLFYMRVHKSEEHSIDDKVTKREITDAPVIC